MITIVIASAIARPAKMSKQKAVRIANIYCQFIVFRCGDTQNSGNKVDKKNELLIENSVSFKKWQQRKRNVCETSNRMEINKYYALLLLYTNIYT